MKDKVNKNQIFIFFGPPGSGKGTLSRLCVNRLGWVQLSTGNLCRKHINEKTEIGKKIDFAINSGKLIEDSLIIEMVNHWLNDNLYKVDSIIMDGFPRTVMQAEALDHSLKLLPFNICLSILHMKISDNLVVDRLLSRAICQNKDCQMVYSLKGDLSLRPKNKLLCDICLSPLIRRSDDEKETIEDRIKTYRQYENDLISFYRKLDYSIVEVEVGQSVEQVYYDFLKLINLRSK